MKYGGLIPRLCWVAIPLLIPILPAPASIIFHGSSTIVLAAPALALALLLSYVSFSILDEWEGKAASIVKGIFLSLCGLLFLLAGVLVSFDAGWALAGISFGSVWETAYVACWFPSSVIALYLDKKCAEEGWGDLFCSFLPMIVFAPAYCACLIIAAISIFWTPLGVTVPTAAGLILASLLLCLSIAEGIGRFKRGRKSKARNSSSRERASCTAQVK